MLDRTEKSDEMTLICEKEEIEYPSYYDQICETRTRIRKGIFSEFLLDYSIGRFLVEKNICSHPVEVEKSENSFKFNDLKRKYKKFQQDDQSDDDFFQELIKPDLKNRTAVELQLEDEIDKRVAYRMDFLGRQRKVNELFDFNEDDFETKINWQQFRNLISDKKFILLRDEFFACLDGGRWEDFINLVEVNFASPILGKALETWIEKFSKFIFENRFFKKILFEILIKSKIFGHEGRFRKLENIFWVELGFQFREDERQELMKGIAAGLWDWMKDQRPAEFEKLSKELSIYGMTPILLK